MTLSAALGMEREGRAGEGLVGQYRMPSATATWSAPPRHCVWGTPLRTTKWFAFRQACTRQACTRRLQPRAGTRFVHARPCDESALCHVPPPLPRPLARAGRFRRLTAGGLWPLEEEAAEVQGTTWVDVSSILLVYGLLAAGGGGGRWGCRTGHRPGLVGDACVSHAGAVP